jgi:hypothetical protein
MTEPQDAVEGLRDGTTTSAPSIASALICNTTTASTDEPSLGPTVAHANLTDTEDSLFMTACAFDLTGEEFESGQGGYSDLLHNRPIGLSFEPS